MAKTQVLIRPLITEKAENLQEARNQYTFVVARKSNKLQIRKAIEDMYEVKVASVNTMVMPAKAKNRNTRSGVIRGRISPYKKAIITLKDGDIIDFFGDI